MLPEMIEDPYIEVALQAPPSLNYIPGPEEPEQAPPSPDYVPGPEHADDEIVAEDQPYAEDGSPIAQSLEYVPESDFAAHLEDDDDEDPEEDPVDYPADGGDDGDDEEESSEDDEDEEDDDMDIEADEEEEEHPAPANSVVVAPTAADWAPSVEETKPFETDELLAISSPPASPLSPWSSPPPQIPFPPLPPILSPPSPVLSPAPPPSTIRSLGYRAAMIRLRDEAASTLSPPLQLPSTSRREDRPEVTLPPQKRLGIALGPRYKVGESSSAAAGCLRADYSFVATMDREIMHDLEREIGYGITDSWDEIVETLQGAPVSTNTVLGKYMREFETRVRQDTEEIYMRLDDEQTERQLLAGRLNMLFRDRHASDLVHGEVMSLRTTVLSQMSEIRELQAVDRRRQTVILELLRIDHRRSIEIVELRTALQGHVTTLQGQKQMAPKRTARSTTDQETINATSVTNAQLQAMIDQGVTAALAARDALRSTNRDDSHNSGTGVRRTERATHECINTNFLNCQPLPFKGTKGVASLSQWCERMESVFHISNCAVENQVKFATCTLHSVALTWWNTHVKTVGHEATYGLPDIIHGSVVASKPKTIQEAIEIATELMDKKIRTFTKRETASKRKFENTSRNTQNQQQQSNKRQNTGHVYTATSGEKKQYGDLNPYALNAIITTTNNNNHGNQGGRNNAPARVYAIDRAGTDPDANVVTGTFLLNNRYASVLFDTGADRSFVSTTFSTQINITPSTLDHYYDVELADGRVIGLNTILRGCTLNLLNHPFNIDLMPVELEKYVKKGFPIFLAHITTKEVEDKSEKKRLEDVPIVQDFPEVFPEELPGLPPTRPEEFQIDLVPGAAPVARAPYRLAPSEMKELAKQLRELSDKGFIRSSSSP
nr:hypothetical protein [Tanacetum cinerariifolium]